MPVALACAHCDHEALQPCEVDQFFDLVLESAEGTFFPVFCAQIKALKVAKAVKEHAGHFPGIAMFSFPRFPTWRRWLVALRRRGNLGGVPSHTCNSL